MIESRNCKATM